MKKYAIALAFAALPFATTAQALNYNYVEGGLVMYSDIDGEDLTGFGVRASYELEQVDPKAFVYGGYTLMSDNIDVTQLHFGAGYRFEINNQTEAWAGAGFDSTKVKVKISGLGTFSDSDTALALRGGVRHQLTEDTELAATMRIVTGDYDYTGFAFTVRQRLNEQLSLLGEIDSFDGDIGFIAGVHYGF
ncbi:outer membrane beta-barrel protein [Marinospirillum alkaliphilum]|uniref:Outer membrane protein beta-barrel domain-containing protein n=1 Tax=Marinospirillum alkaliphilum DSM 21637 TaxID=1122209 RepID=A0A1K1V7C3_9GAMM|nr:outer membrane beta-barrel protein [Marinospirillum alkaliphilum]SFX20668.1 Outer membrane protein beta-barrel domain-containing protein [Marinospirillum alkaliphilum DSM 21637]